MLQEFDVSRYDVESLGKLDRILEKGTDKYSYIFIDEAHRFRNSGMMKQENPNSNTQELERQIDEILYATYELSAEEIALVEAACN